MLPDRVSTPGPLTYESGALPTALRGPASGSLKVYFSVGGKTIQWPQIERIRAITFTFMHGLKNL